MPARPAPGANLGPAPFRVGMITETRGCSTPARTAPARRADSETATATAAAAAAAEGAVTARVSVTVITTASPAR